RIPIAGAPKHRSWITALLLATRSDLFRIASSECRSKERHERSCLLFECQFSAQAVPVATDRRHGELPVIAPEGHCAVACGRIGFNFEPVPLLGMADIGDGRVVVLAPEERHRVEASSSAEHVGCGDAALTLRDNPVFNADMLS